MPVAKKINCISQNSAFDELLYKSVYHIAKTGKYSRNATVSSVYLVQCNCTPPFLSVGAHFSLIIVSTAIILFLVSY